MMTPNECANAWKQVNRIYDETISENNPEVTMSRIIAELGMENTLEVFAAITVLNERDGRISPRNKSIMCEIPVLPECTEWNHGNPMIYANIDHIHKSHIDNLLNELIEKMEVDD